MCFILAIFVRGQCKTLYVGVNTEKNQYNEYITETMKANAHYTHLQTHRLTHKSKFAKECHLLQRY
jgi:hypothetical protein